MFSKSCEYAIKAAIFIAINSLLDRKVGSVDIAKEINSPEAFTAKILQKLSKDGIIHSVRGVNGGFFIPKKLISEIKLAQIVFAIDGDVAFKGCGLGMEKCNANHPCPLHEKFMSIRNDLRQMLETTNLEELAVGLKSGETFLKQ
ncbi:Rrf2 family transcriptional regulator [Flavobacterium azooxidireducens]|uniref:Rrf2 family transcriptional regulator n=1 Tax=Flavobacterium azooxidireducens TaxID=1871076 RepID=A0ABY4KEG2_9FLAO|nr:Rrf2 family transcriptional regulator [Flavobacterium azooxidireducens]UPQ78178.1 Rrf2 family transcriptional regulator [Flavobacterium azooxidireducens]